MKGKNQFLVKKAFVEQLTASTNEVDELLKAQQDRAVISQLKEYKNKLKELETASSGYKPDFKALDGKLTNIKNWMDGFKKQIESGEEFFEPVTEEELNEQYTGGGIKEKHAKNERALYEALAALSESATGKNLSYKVTDKAQIKGIVDGGKLGIMPVGGGEKQQGVIFESQKEAIFISREAFLGLAERVLNNKVLNKDASINKFFGDIELGGVYKVSEKLIEVFKNLSAGEFKEQAQMMKK